MFPMDWASISCGFRAGLGRLAVVVGLFFLVVMNVSSFGNNRTITLVPFCDKLSARAAKINYPTQRCPNPSDSVPYLPVYNETRL